MLIYFDRPECPRHKKPLQYLCMIPECQCQIRLCVNCTAEHCKKYGKGDFMRQQNFYKKLEMETDIIAKQYSFLEQHLGKEEGSSLLASKNQESIKMVEFVMKVVNQDKKAVYKAIDQFSYNHMGVRKKLANLQANYSREYLEHIQNPTPLSIIINLSTNEGLDRLRRTVLNCQNTTKRYHQFLAATQKYGKNTDSFLSGLGFQNVLLKESIKKLVVLDKIDHGKIAAEAEKIESPERKRNNDQNAQNLNRCEQVFAPVPGMPNKIKLLTPQKRPKTSSSSDKIID